MFRLLGLIIFKIKSSKGKLNYKKNQELCVRYAINHGTDGNNIEMHMSNLSQLDSFVRENLKKSVNEI